MPTQTPRSLKILVFSSRGWGTGCPLRARYIAQALKTRGHQVQFVEPLHSLPLWFDMVLSTFYYFIVSLLHTSQVAFAVKPYPNVIPALWVQRLKGAKVVIDVDDLDYAYNSGWFQKFHRWIETPWPAWADFVTYHNPNLLEPLESVFHVPASRCVSLPQGVDTHLFFPKAPNTDDLPFAARILVGREDVRPILAFGAYLNKACDLEPILEAFRKVHRVLPLSQLLVAGGGPDEGRFKHMVRMMGISPSVHFTGYIHPRQVAACLNLSDAALAYYGEANANEHRSSMKLREALACGCRVVAAGVDEEPQSKKGLTLSKTDPESFAKAVLSALKRKKNTRATALLVKKWDWTFCVKNLETELLKP